jgi:hypothetical protein
MLDINLYFFLQIVFIVGLTEMKKPVACVYALLPSKEKGCYLRLANAVKTELQQLPNWQEVKSIMTDYEMGMIKAFHETFPAAKMAGCEFHRKNCLRKKLDTIGLKTLYNHNIEFILLVRYIWALAFVPLDKVVTIWETLIQEKVIFFTLISR